MANEPLRQALASANMTSQALAEGVGVDPKTAARWVAHPERTPHLRHRLATAQALGVGEEVLWPASVASMVKCGAGREVVAVWPARSAVPVGLWRDLVTRATREVTFAGYTSYFLWLDHANLAGALRRKATQGCRVRFLVGDPGSEVTRRREEVEQHPLTVSSRIQVTLAEMAKLRGTEGVQARFSDGHVALSVFVFDRDAVVCTHIADRLGNASPTFHLRRQQDGGLFDQYTAHVETLWAAGRDVWAAPAGPGDAVTGTR